MKKDEKRLFTAISLPESWIQALARTEKALRSEGIRGRFLPAERLHITINFIGETRKEEEIRETLETLGRSGRPSIKAVGGGIFRRRGGSLIVWHIEAGQALVNYQKREADALARLGIARDARSYRPHLTLARDVEGPFLHSSAFEGIFHAPPSFEAEELLLFWSRFDQGRLTYTPVARFAFGEPSLSDLC